MVVNIEFKKHASSGVSGYAGSRGSLLAKLFLPTLHLSASTFGGGYIVVTLMKKKSVDECYRIDEQEMLDLIAITQSSPGAIAVNGVIVVGYRLTGTVGVLTAVITIVLPPFAILILISFCYVVFCSNLLAGWMLDGMQAGVGAVIAQVVWEMGSGIAEGRQWISVLIMAAAFIANYVYNVNAVLTILSYAAIGVGRTLTFGYNKKGAGGGVL